MESRGLQNPQRVCQAISCQTRGMAMCSTSAHTFALLSYLVYLRRRFVDNPRRRKRKEGEK